MPRPSPFPTRLQAGQTRGEAPVWVWAGRGGWDVELAGQEDQRRGIDGWLSRPGSRLSIECKWQGEPRPGFFLELSKGPLCDSEGWLYTTQADRLALVEHAGRFAVLCRPEALRRRVGGWVELYGTAPGSAGGRTRSTGVWVEWWRLSAAGRVYDLGEAAPERI